jgi:Uma2 family endonuclease
VSTVPTSTMTAEEYLAIERRAESRSEFRDGRIFAMSGGSREHSPLTGNVAAVLWAQLRDRPCETYSSAMRVKVSSTGLYTYPDVIVVCGEPRFEDAFVDTLLNPTVIVEVLSDSTEAYDRGRNFGHYRRLDSLKEYVVVSQTRMMVEKYVRQGEQRVLHEATDPNASLILESIGCRISLREIYERVELLGEESEESRRK